MEMEQHCSVAGVCELFSTCAIDEVGQLNAMDSQSVLTEKVAELEKTVGSLVTKASALENRKEFTDDHVTAINANTAKNGEPPSAAPTAPPTAAWSSSGVGCVQGDFMTQEGGKANKGALLT
jgi:hypothetical protein